MKTPDHSTFMTMAEEVAEKSNCVRRSVGAVIVRQGQVLSSGWNGLPERRGDCREAGCPRCTYGGDTGSGYENCICIHAEQHAIADAARRGVSIEGSTMYVCNALPSQGHRACAGFSFTVKIGNTPKTSKRYTDN